MKVSTEKIEGSRMVLNIEVESEEMERSLHEAYHRLAARTTIPGFRRGKAPRLMLERHLGKEALVEDAVNHLVPDAYQRAVREQGIEVIAQPDVEIVQTDPVVFKATVSLRPTVELGDYHNIRIASEEVAVDEGEITEGMERLRQVQAPWEPVERSAIIDDLLSIDVHGNVEDKTLFDEKGHWYQLSPQSVSPAPGFAEKLVGAASGEERVFTLPLPSEYGELADKECHFKVLVGEIKQKILPELDDEFAKSLGQGLETLDALKDRVVADLRAAKEREQRRKIEEEVIAAVVALAHLEFPEVLVEHELDHLVAERGRFLGGKERLDDYLKNVNKTEEEFRNELRPIAERNVSRSLVMEQVAELEAIEVSAVEIDAEVELLVQGTSQSEVRQLLASPSARESLTGRLRGRKTIDRLVEIALGHEELTPSSANEGEESNGDTT